MEKYSTIKEQFQKYKNGWINSFRDGFSQDEQNQAIPWMTYPAIEFLQNDLHQNHRIFEFGCGASTLFFAKNAQETISLESNKIWFEIITKKLFEIYGGKKEANYFSNEKVEIFLMEDALISDNYQNFAKKFIEKFDLIIVDSLKRFECAKNSVEALKTGGSIILDDSQRTSYKKIFDFFSDKNFSKMDFIGISPGQLNLKNTSFFTRKLNPDPLLEILKEFGCN